MTLLDRFLPVADTARRLAVDVAAPAERVWEALVALRPAQLTTIRLLFALRTLRWSRVPPLPMAEGLRRAGFVVLGEDRPREWVVGAAGRFWVPSGGIVRLADAREFAAFSTRGAARAAMAFSIEATGPSTSRLITETRIQTFGEEARRWFALYWKAVGPFSAIVRRAMLGAVRRAAEAHPDAPAAGRR